MRKRLSNGATVKVVVDVRGVTMPRVPNSENELREIANGLLHTLRASLALYSQSPSVAVAKLDELRLLISELAQATKSPNRAQIEAISADSAELAAFINADLGGCRDWGD